VWRVKVDPSQVDQILANLCVNARDAIAGVGQVSIQTSNVVIGGDGCDRCPDAVPGDFVLLSVSDTGCGLDPEVLSHLFEPFFTTKGVGQGTGLGLATIYGIVRQNEGFITVDSVVGQGTTFGIHLPRYARGELPRQDTSAAIAVRGQETILLVEDEPAILALGRRMLESLGYTVLTASRPGEAIRLAETHPGEIHLLMTDVVMPEMNGRDLAKNLMSLHPTIKRLFMSGYTADVIAHQGVLDAGVHFMQKPFSMRELAAKVRQALDRD
jgi:CheY-like chemotaxis protein